MLHARLLAAPRGTTGPDAEHPRRHHPAFVAVLRTLNTQIAALEDSIGDQLDIHPDAHIVTSLPRVGTLRAARLLAEIGDARGRFPTADSLACLAGVAPSTRQSGKVKAVTFRWAADKQLRDALCDFAGDSRHANPWAADLYDRPSPAATTTPTPSASSAEPGRTSSGAAGKTTSPTTPANTAPSNHPHQQHPRPPDTPEVDTGQLIRRTTA